MNKKGTRFFGLGGFQEIGKSTAVIEHDDQIFIVDAGIQFANGSLTGIKGIIPDYQYLIDNEERIQGLFLTHGHEDHMGGIAYLVQNCNIKRIVAPSVGISYIKFKLDERKIKTNIEWIEIDKNLVLTFGDMKVDFWSAQHSIPDAYGIRFTNRNGSMFFTGDFRIDYTPIGSYPDFTKLEQIGQEDLTVLFSDSTNAMRPYHSPSEKDILKAIREYMEQAPKKIIITAFASNMSRISAIIKIAQEMNKKVVAFGHSMVNGINIARQLGYIDVDDSIFIDKKHVSKYDDNELLILTTGSQGEALAGLAKMAEGKHPQISIKHNDLIIFSSSPIPGNRIKIELLINDLYKLGANIKENKIDGYLHTSGHAYQEEHRKIFELTKPTYFFPYHGEFRMSVVHGRTAEKAGVNPDNIVIASHGEVYEMLDRKIFKTNDKIVSNPIYIDGEIASAKNTKLINEREQLGENGFVYISLLIDKEKADIVGRTKIITRGTLYVKSSTDIISDIRRIVHGLVLFTIKNSNDWTSSKLKKYIQERVKSYFYKTKRRSPYVCISIQYLDDLKFVTIPKEVNA
ncbi:ribonuclease J [Metamycoplasma sualvi]|uniref:ribonuclease J n=1 Tax=Metamycoplasma sualvi TaxID=2125 RepID=UPI003873A81F